MSERMQQLDEDYFRASGQIGYFAVTQRDYDCHHF
jgi:hypothetical protein